MTTKISNRKNIPPFVTDKDNKKIKFIGPSGIKYLKDIEITGSFIVIEGPDASGRSTQIQKITEKLESDGHAVVNTGLKRSDLISKGIIEAKRNYVGRRTMALYYAADFADQLENKIIPALKAGFVVIADRYIYTLIARSSVRGINKNWLHQLHSFAIKPDLIFYLNVDPYNLIHRVFKKNKSLDYYESGADLGISDDIFNSFIKYQYLLKKEFKMMQNRYGLINIDGDKEIDEIYEEIESKISEYLNRKKTGTIT
ncbi:MAG: dTMP kinase [Candidatus Nitrosocosmicus sp.]|jgi:dTMP kinase|uniref:dTMP kinase n=1 Tax=Candidatus Nitrosocosmicus agrestis TaxID=2563600 RepID=UPI00122E5748|nr:dTMP kinase [Candidatus Nitrosocosmicus sp. SS]KAA2279650.1 dTMP kinase [Candidatus Nitrosocosmicus sp. SS]KAF0868197.1 dTMP kinase [Candidatus Nitrosocosmicus sp. SS]HET8793634.1 dTMP kinase [Nitrososphaeraceae archaeon]